MAKQEGNSPCEPGLMPEDFMVILLP